MLHKILYNIVAGYMGKALCFIVYCAGLQLEPGGRFFRGDCNDSRCSKRDERG